MNEWLLSTAAGHGFGWRQPGKISVVIIVYLCISRKGCTRLFELFVRLESAGDAEPTIAQLYPATADDQVHATFMLFLLLPHRKLC